MFGQDWQPVILKNPGLTKKTSRQHDGTHTLDSESNELSHNKVGICIGKQIERARNAAGFKTRAELAFRINESVKTITEYETGKAIPDSKVLQKLRNALKVQIKVSK
jgi:ribosome-binding protein aMBF1 (putative translation factor)